MTKEHKEIWGELKVIVAPIDSREKIIRQLAGPGESREPESSHTTSYPQRFETSCALNGCLLYVIFL